MIRNRFLKILALLLCVILCTGLLSACQKKADPLTTDGFSSLRINQGRGTVSATVSLSARTLQEKTGQIAFLYELLPGQGISSLTSASEPLDQVRVSAYMKFQFDLMDGERSRLFSTFALIFEDGSSLLSTGHAIENPEALAQGDGRFLWAEAPKGLFATDVHDAASLGVRHTAVSLSFSELLGEGADTTYSYGNVTLTYSSSALARLDPQVRRAHAIGLQVTLAITPDLALSPLQTAAVMELLTSRYSTEEHGIVSAILLQPSDSVTAASAAELCFFSHHALRSHVRNGRVYVSAPIGSLESNKAFFTDLRLYISKHGNMEWGACVTAPIRFDTPEDATPVLSPADLSALSASILSSSLPGRASYFAVCGQAVPHGSEDKLAAAFAYTYHAAINANASLFLYTSHMDDAIGVRLASGEERELTAFFRDVDAGLDEEQTALCTTLLKEQNLQLASVKPSRTEHTMSASIGYSQADSEPLYDFTTGDTLGFVGVGNVTDPACKTSSVFNAPVLYTWLDPAYGNEAGVCKVMQDGSALRSAISVTVSMLAQVPNTDTCTVRLRLDGVSKSGGTLSYESLATVRSGQWQAVTFQISDFAADADLSAPCVLTLTTEPSAPTDEEYVLWIAALDAAIPASTLSYWIPILLVLGGVALGFLCVALIYRLPKKRKANKH